MFEDVLPRWERYLYWLAGISSISYISYMAFLEGEKHDPNARFTSGWSWIGRAMYHSDFVWKLWLEVLPLLLPINIAHVILSQTFFYFKLTEKTHTNLLALVDMCAAYFIFGVRPVAFLLIVTTIMYLITFCRSVLLIWLLASGLVYLQNSPSAFSLLTEYLEPPDFNFARLLRISSAIFYTRLVSFALEKIEYRKTRRDMATLGSGDEKTHSSSDLDKKSQQALRGGKSISDEIIGSCATKLQTRTVDSDPSFMNLIFFSFYLPTLLWGPIFVYGDFHRQIKHSLNSSVSTENVRNIVKQLIKLAAYIFLLEFQLHFLYFRALALHPVIVERMSLWGIWGLIYCQSVFFYLMYLIMYGVGIQISRFDGIKPLGMPRCFNWVYSFNDIWKYFDVGLYNFIRNHIYIPMGGSRRGFCRQIIASALSFLFIYVWHGTSSTILVWSVGNYVLITLELTAAKLEASAVGLKMVSCVSSSMYLRLKAVSVSVLYVASVILISYFFFGAATGWAIFSAMVLKARWVDIATQIFLLMCGVQNALYVSQWYKHQGDKEKHK